MLTLTAEEQKKILSPYVEYYATKTDSWSRAVEIIERAKNYIFESHQNNSSFESVCNLISLAENI